MKLICAGFPKTGTKSLTRALQILGYTDIFDYLEHIDYFLDDYDNFFDGKEILPNIFDKYDRLNVQCVVDMPSSFLFEEFHKRWPKAKVILTVRSEKDWFKSIQKMNQLVFNTYHWMTYFSSQALKFENFMRKLYQYMLGEGTEKSWLWKMHYRRHNNYVQQVVPPDNLLVLDVADGWGPLCKFLGKPIPDEPFPFVNAAGSKGNIVERLLGETATARRAKYQIIFSIIFYLVVFGLLIYALQDLFF
ncbi:uncharacterized protein LOC144745955 [Ciona intestinalis]